VPFDRKLIDLLFGRKLADSPFGRKPLDSPFERKLKELLFRRKLLGSQNGRKLVHLPFEKKLVESPFGRNSCVPMGRKCLLPFISITTTDDRFAHQNLLTLYKEIEKIGWENSYLAVWNATCRLTL